MLSPPPAPIAASNRRSGIYTNLVVPTTDPALLSAKPALPSPKLFFAHFISSEKEFIRFLEVVVERRWGSKSLSSDHALPEGAEDEQSIWNTLLELYLSQAAAVPASKGELEAKAMDLLRRPDPTPYEATQALLVCTTARFEEGVILLYERLDMVEEILRYRIASGNSTRAVQTLWKYGPTNGSLYKIALRWLSSDASIYSKHTEDVERILTEIESRKLMKPVEVVKLLGRNNIATVGLLKNYLRAGLELNKGEIESDKALIQSYRKETAAKRKEIDALTDPKTPRVFQITRCSACGGSLDLPSVQYVITFIL